MTYVTYSSTSDMVTVLSSFYWPYQEEQKPWCSYLFRLLLIPVSKLGPSLRWVSCNSRQPAGDGDSEYA